MPVIKSDKLTRNFKTPKIRFNIGVPRSRIMLLSYLIVDVIYPLRDMTKIYVNQETLSFRKALIFINFVKKLFKLQ